MMAPEMIPAADQAATVLQRYAESGQDVDFMRLIAAFHLDSIARVCFNQDLGVLETFEDGPSDLERAYEYLLDELPRRAYATDADVQNDFESDTPDNRMMAEMSYLARNVVRKLIAARLERLAAGEPAPSDLLDVMMNIFIEQYPEAKGNLDMLTAELGDNLVEIFFAGYNTAVPTTCHSLYFLATHPEIQERLIQELDTVLEGRRPTVDDLPKLVFCERVILEALRLCPPASLVSRQTTRDLVLEGVPIPRATRVWMPACYIHRDPDFWGPDANEFNPDRWEKKPPRGSFIPFADGARNCAGRNYAMYEMTLGICSVLQSFRVQPAPDMDWKTIFTGFGLRPADLTEARVCMRLNVVPREELQR